MRLRSIFSLGLDWSVAEPKLEAAAREALDAAKQLCLERLSEVFENPKKSKLDFLTPRLANWLKNKQQQHSLEIPPMVNFKGLLCCTFGFYQLRQHNPLFGVVIYVVFSQVELAVHLHINRNKGTAHILFCSELCALHMHSNIFL